MQAIIVNGTPKEIAAIALEMQGRQEGSVATPAGIIREVVRPTIHGKQQDIAR